MHFVTHGAHLEQDVSSQRASTHLPGGHFSSGSGDYLQDAHAGSRSQGRAGWIPSRPVMYTAEQTTNSVQNEPATGSRGDSPAVDSGLGKPLGCG